MKTCITCPLGSECEKIVGDHIERCAWYISLVGTDPTTGDKVDERKCAIAWQPLLAIEANGTGFKVATAIQSLRNETIKRQDIALGAINGKAIRS